MGRDTSQERAKFIQDFTRAFQAAAELGEWTVLEQTMVECRSTALIYTDPALLQQLTKPTGDDFGPVPNPVGG